MDEVGCKGIWRVCNDIRTIIWHGFCFQKVDISFSITAIYEVGRINVIFTVFTYQCLRNRPISTGRFPYASLKFFPFQERKDIFLVGCVKVIFRTFCICIGACEFLYVPSLSDTLLACRTIANVIFSFHSNETHFIWSAMRTFTVSEYMSAVFTRKDWRSISMAVFSQKKRPTFFAGYLSLWNYRSSYFFHWLNISIFRNLSTFLTGLINYQNRTILHGYFRNSPSISSLSASYVRTSPVLSLRVIVAFLNNPVDMVFVRTFSKLIVSPWNWTLRAGFISRISKSGWFMDCLVSE